MKERNRTQPHCLRPLFASQEATASFAQWERLMKGSGSGVVAADNSFTEVMSLVTQMYKQTAIAKVMRDQVVLESSHNLKSYLPVFYTFMSHTVAPLLP